MAGCVQGSVSRAQGLLVLEVLCGERLVVGAPTLYQLLVSRTHTDSTTPTTNPQHVVRHCPPTSPSSQVPRAPVQCSCWLCAGAVRPRDNHPQVSHAVQQPRLPAPCPHDLPGCSHCEGGSGAKLPYRHGSTRTRTQTAQQVVCLRGRLVLVGCFVGVLVCVRV